MSKLAIAKIAVNLVVGASVSKVTNDIISNNTTVETTEDQVKVAIGSIVIGMIAVEHAREYTNGVIDDGVEIWQARKERKAEKKAEKEKKKATEK